MKKNNKAKVDNYELITDAIVDALERCQNKEEGWECPWFIDGAHRNGVGRKYQGGVNILLLSIAKMVNNFSSSQWYTYNQAQNKGGQVRKGERGTSIFFFRFIEKDDEKNEGEKVKVPIFSRHTVFNYDQIDGLPPSEASKVTELSESERFDVAENVISNTGAKITFGGDKAYYRPSTDSIKLPPFTKFRNSPLYYSTAFHELGHWTGHSSRLDRVSLTSWGKESYAFEELVAELTAAFVCGELGLKNGLQHPEYIAFWIQHLKNDKKAVYKASKLASDAANLILGPDWNTDSASDEEGDEA